MKRQEKFWWFDEHAADDIRGKLNAAGPGARLEFHLDPKTDEAMVFVVPDGVTAEEGGGTNQSHVCPPICP